MYDLDEFVEDLETAYSFNRREELRKQFIKEHFLKSLKTYDLANIDPLAPRVSVIEEIFDQWLPYDWQIYAFFDYDILKFINEFLPYYPGYEINYVQLASFYANNIVWENIEQWWPNND